MRCREEGVNLWAVNAKCLERDILPEEQKGVSDERGVPEERGYLRREEYLRHCKLAWARPIATGTTLGEEWRR